MSDNVFQLPITPYGNHPATSGWSGSTTSRNRAVSEDSNGTTSERQSKILNYLAFYGKQGGTWKEIGEYFGWHHGQVSGALSVLHKAGAIARLTGEVRNRCEAYVLPEYVDGREVSAQGRGNNEARIRSKIVEELEDWVGWHECVDGLSCDFILCDIDFDQFEAVLNFIRNGSADVEV